MILGEDIFPIRELSQHEKDVQTVYSAIGAIASVMEDNRANGLEILLYQTYLLYQATLGGSIGIELNDPRQQAFDTIDSLWRFISNDDVERSDDSLEKPFICPQFTADVYRDVFHELLSDKYYEIVDYIDDIPFVMDQWEQSSIYPKHARAIKSFFSPIIKRDGARILDCDANSLPPDYSFDGIERYVLYEQNPIFYAFLVLRKELEGDVWGKVEITNQIDSIDGVFDCVLLGRSFSDHGELLNSISDYSSHICDKGHLILQCETLNAGACISLTSSGMLDKVISIEDPRGYARNVYLLQVNKESTDVTFAELGLGGQTLEILENNTVDTLNGIDPDRIISVPYSDLLKSNLNPCYYLLLRDAYVKGSVPLKKYVSKCVERETSIRAKDAVKGGVVNTISTDTRLLETRPDESTEQRGDCYPLSDSSLLIRRKFGGGLAIGYILINHENPVLIDSHILAYPVDDNSVDIRYLVICLRNSPLFELVTEYSTGANDLLEFYLPELSLQEQNQFIDNYLRDLKNEFNSKIDVKDSSLQLLVFTPDKAGFESDNKERIDKLGFKVLEYVENKNSLKAALSEHYGEKVLSSNLADAVLVCADMPAMDVQKAIYFVGKVGIRTFYYSNNPAYDASDIDEDYLDDFKTGFLSGDDYLESIRKILDADSNKVRDRYPKFFKSADRLDEEYGWNLAEFATLSLKNNPFQMAGNFRSMIDDTIISFFKGHHVVPYYMDNGAVPSLIADREFDDRNKISITLNERLHDTVFKKEAWYKYALVALRKYGNKDNHSSELGADSALELATFTLFTEVIVWLDSIRDRYKDKRCLFTIKRDESNLPFYTVESYDIGGREYLIANRIHLIDSKNELRAGDQVVVIDTEEEKYPKTINGFRVERVAKSNNYLVVIKA